MFVSAVIAQILACWQLAQSTSVLSFNLTEMLAALHLYLSFVSSLYALQSREKPSAPHTMGNIKRS